MTAKTYRLRKAEMDRKWQVLDADDRPLGRIASEAAKLLLGKHKPDYEPHLVMGDHVIVVNAGRVKFTGNKVAQKVYYRHSGYPGGLKSIALEKMLQTRPDRVIEHAVKGMLPKNRLGNSMIKKLKVYAGDSHPHLAQTNAGK